MKQEMYGEQCSQYLKRFSTPDIISNESAQTVSTDVFGDKVVSSLTDLLS